jgi:predicted transcriptional regulator
MPTRTSGIRPRQRQILSLLWQHGPSSVRELHGHMPELAYTTVLTMCVRLVDKGAARAVGQRPAIPPARPMPMSTRH